MGIAREALKSFWPDTSSSVESLSDEDILRRFTNEAEQLTGPQMVRMLRSVYAKVPVPSFYQDLALLIRERYFPLIITTNFDNLLEQALASSGVRNSEYRVTMFDSQRISSRSTDTPDLPPLTHIVKLHGDLAQNSAHISPEEIEAALSASKRWIKAELAGDLVMIGHIEPDDLIDRWLASSNQRQLWWIDPKPPTDPARVQPWATEYHEITGDLARPQIFFSQLSLRLLRETETATTFAIPPLESLGSFEALAVLEEPEEIPLPEMLQREVRRTQAVLYNLEQETVAGTRPAQVQTQIEYQKRQISRIEEKIRSLPEVKPLVLDIVKKIGIGIVRAQEDPSTSFSLENLAQYIQTQVDTLEREFEKDTPNQFLVSASLGATLTLADRLVTEFGSKVVDPDSVRQLAALTPSASGKVIL